MFIKLKTVMLLLIFLFKFDIFKLMSNIKKWYQINNTWHTLILPQNKYNATGGMIQLDFFKSFVILHAVKLMCIYVSNNLFNIY